MFCISFALPNRLSHPSTLGKRVAAAFHVSNVCATTKKNEKGERKEKFKVVFFDDF